MGCARPCVHPSLPGSVLEVPLVVGRHHLPLSFLLGHSWAAQCHLWIRVTVLPYGSLLSFHIGFPPESFFFFLWNNTHTHKSNLEGRASRGYEPSPGKPGTDVSPSRLSSIIFHCFFSALFPTPHSLQHTCLGHCAGGQLYRSSLQDPNQDWVPGSQFQIRGRENHWSSA